MLILFPSLMVCHIRKKKKDCQYLGKVFLKEKERREKEKYEQLYSYPLTVHLKKLTCTL